MYQNKLTLVILLFFNIIFCMAMDNDFSSSYSESNRSDLESDKIVTPISISTQNQMAIQAAENCDIVALQKNVNESNINIVNDKGNSLLSLSFVNHEHSHFTQVLDFLFSKGAQAEKRVSEQEPYSPLVVAIGAAILYNQFIPLRYLFFKKVNPFLKDQTETGKSAALIAAQSLTGNEQQRANQKRVIELIAFCASNLHEALETFDFPAIMKFISPETVNAPKDNLTPLLRVAKNCTRVLRNNGREIVELLFKYGALPNELGIINDIKTVPLHYITINSILMGDCDTAVTLIPVFLKHGANPQLNPEAGDEDDNSPYGVAKFLKTIATNAAKNHNCQKKNCEKCIEINMQKITATRILSLFNTHFKKNAKK